MTRSLAVALALVATQALAADWPHWRGANRSDVTADPSGWDAKMWPPDDTAWSVNVGLGGTSPIVAGGRVYVMGHKSGAEILSCLDATSGATLWTQSYKAPVYGRHAIGDKSFYKGPSATPELDPETGLIYTLGIDGVLNCWDTKKDGANVWKHKLYDIYKIPQRPQVTKRKSSHRDYGYTTAPLVVNDWLIVEVGDPKRGNLFAFDKQTGTPAWSSENKDPAGHTGGLTPMTVDGIPCVAVLTALNLVVTRLDGANAGKTVAAYPWATDFINNIPTPAAEGNAVLITSRYNRMAMCKLEISLRGGAKKVWENAYPSGVCSPIIHDGSVYFANKGFHCVDFKTGKLRWEGGKYGAPGSCILTADERIITWANDGDLTLVESAGRSPSRYTELGSEKRVLRDMAWPHVVLSGGRLFCKDRGGNLKCFAMDSKAVAATPVKPKPKPSAGSIDPRTLPGSWPGSGDALVLGWRQGNGKRGIKGTVASGGRRASWDSRDNGKISTSGAMVLDGEGAILLKGDHEALSDAFRKTNELTIETIFRAENVEQDGPSRFLTFSESAYSRNFTLGQVEEKLVLRLRTTKTGENGSNPETTLCEIEENTLYHCIVSYRPGELVCFMNGENVFGTSRVEGTLEGWTAQHFLIGDEWDGKRPWAGEVHGLALWNRFMDESTAQKRFALIDD